MTPAKHLYLHVPFCRQVCPYCDFHKHTAAGYDQVALIEDGLLKELWQAIVYRNLSCSPETIYIGGGTPSLLSRRTLESLLSGIHEMLDFSRLREWTVECDPGTFAVSKAESLQSFGVNRISLGAQSFDRKELALLGRTHTPKQIYEAFDILRGIGFNNINLDLIYALPGQDLAQWQSNLRKALECKPEHISAYCLTYEPKTPFAKKIKVQDRLKEEEIADYFFACDKILTPAELFRYETSNFAKKNFESKHNMAYWLGEDYVGIGPGAVSSLGGRRWKNLADTRGYLQRCQNGLKAPRSFETLSLEDLRLEKVALGLRTTRGILMDDICANGERENKRNKGKLLIVNELINGGYLQKNNDRLCLSLKGHAVADAIIESLI